MTLRLPASHSRAKAIIAACAKVGAGIEYLPDAPRFRYTPPETVPLHRGKPSKRTAFSYPNKGKFRTWRPANVGSEPMYSCPMAGDSRELTKARKAWHDGNPEPLRQWLAEQAA